MPSRPPGTPDLDLTTADSFGEINGGVFMVGALQPAGTGNFNTFLQIQRGGVEQGYNSDHSPQFDEKNNKAHSLLLADIPIVIGDGSAGTVDGLAYREFLLDLNEPNGNTKPYISLDSLQLWQEESGNLNNFTPGSGFAGAHTNYLAYDLDAGGDKWIALTDSLGNGSGKSNYRILIPDSFFINDAAHRYVTLYSKFGAQTGWDADGGFEEWGLMNASGGARSALAVSKTAAAPGGTADTAGEVITYHINVSNTGNTALTGLTVSDPSVSDLAAVMSGGFNVGDVDHDNVFDGGEMWQYTATHTVTQADIDNNGTTGDGTISNTVTADTTQTDAVSATSVINVVQTRALEVTKTPDVTSVDQAGDVINYTINVTNTGTTTVDSVTVTDPQFTLTTEIFNFEAPIVGTTPVQGPILVGDYNIGDTNENGIQDPGETFQYANVGDTNQNGIEDPGEQFVFANVGDTNANGVQDAGETFLFYNAGDTNQNGVEDPGETFQFVVSHQLSGTDANHDGFNDGDVNHNGAIDVGETWQYSVSYTLTQDDIDNGGVVDPSLSHDNTATADTGFVTETASASVDIVQNPHLTLAKSGTVADGTADDAGDVINYTINVVNDGNMTLTGLAVNDPSVSDLAGVMSGGFNAGDADQDGKLDVGETWQYTASYTLTQADIDNGGVLNPALAHDNTATATTDQAAADADASDSDSESIPIVQSPSVMLAKSATVPGGTADTAGEVIAYTIGATNTGNMSLTGVTVTDAFVTDLAAVMSGGFNAGDTNTDGKLSVGETWQYTASHTVTQAEIDDNGGGDGFIENTASVSTAQGASANDSASIEVVQPAPAALFLDKSNAVGTHFVDSDEDGHADVGTDLIQYAFQITNTGGFVLHDVTIDDPLFGGIIYGPETLDPGESFTFSLNHFLTAGDVAAGHVENTATASGLDPSNNIISVMAHYNQLLPA